jgi:hypothetical protein
MVGRWVEKGLFVCAYWLSPLRVGAGCFGGNGWIANGELECWYVEGGECGNLITSGSWRWHLATLSEEVCQRLPDLPLQHMAPALLSVKASLTE